MQQQAEKRDSFSTALKVFYSGALLFCIAMLAFFIWRGDWLQTDLRALLPQDQQWSAIQQQVDLQQERQLNGKVIALVGAEQAQQAFELSQNIAMQWRESGLFAQVNHQFQPNIEQLRKEIKHLAFATLPHRTREQLLQQPDVYFQEYAQQLANPFSLQSLLPLNEDWLGFGRFTLAQSQPKSPLQWNTENGMLWVSAQNKTWVLLQGELSQQNLINPSYELQNLIKKNQQDLQVKGAEMRVTGASLFALQAKQNAEKESQVMSILGITLTLALLLIVFRTLRVFWLFLPILAGVIVGLVATIFCFGQVHILTLVIGTSLIGVLIDFPLHWLAGALVTRQWQGKIEMRKLRLTFGISLLVTLLGYGLLGFTTLPILRQTALFSACALIGAMLFTQCLLPYFFLKYQITRPKRLLLCFYQVRSFFRTFSLFKRRKTLIALASIFMITGIIQSKWQDDIRQWIALPKNLVVQAQQIGELTGVQLSGQYFLVLAENDEKLLQKLTALDSLLESEKNKQNLENYQSLSQWLMTEQQQHDFAQQLQRLQQKDYAPLLAMGIPSQILQQQITALMQQPTLSLQSALNTNLGQVWQSLYLGQIEGQKGAIIQVQKGNHFALSSLANNQDIFWLDKRNHLNQSFQHTRDQAAWLKVLSFVLAGGLLWRYFGMKASAKMLLIPISSVLLTVATFGWLGLPISLFAMFGMLLVSAIAVDYVVYLQSVTALQAHKQLAVLLAASTTMISFLLLTFSTTPAVALFGVSVSLGVLCAVILAFSIYKK